MKQSKLIATIAVALGILSLNSCKKPYVSPYVINANAPKELVLTGKAATFADNSLSVKNRVWTFEDGTPATSTEASVAVTFKTAGDKKVTLKVTFKDDAVKEQEFIVKVAESISGEIKVAGTTPMGCIKIGGEATFSIDKLEGKADKYEWSFEGGKPATSTEASPKVIFENRNRAAKVTCKLTRSSDNVSVVVEGKYIVGNYPVAYANAEYKYDNYGFEDENFHWNSWTEKGEDKENRFVVVEGGANGSAKCLKVNTPDPELSGAFVDIFPRDCWITNAHIEKGKKYELVYWMKADLKEGQEFGIGCVQVINYLEAWMAPANTDLTGEKFNTIFPGVDMKFENEWNRPIKEWWCSSDQENLNHPEKCLADKDGKWKQFTVEFVAPETLHNTYPYFRVYADHVTATYLDEIEINLIEE